MVANKALFMHTHKLANGNLISHAHPFNKSTDNQPFKTHTHSQAELLLISNLEILFLVVFLSLVLHNVLQKTKYSKYIRQDNLLHIIKLQRERAPPLV